MVAPNKGKKPDEPCECEACVYARKRAAALGAMAKELGTVDRKAFDRFAAAALPAILAWAPDSPQCPGPFPVALKAAEYALAMLGVRRAVMSCEAPTGGPKCS